MALAAVPHSLRKWRRKLLNLRSTANLKKDPAIISQFQYKQQAPTNAAINLSFEGNKQL